MPVFVYLKVIFLPSLTILKVILTHHWLFIAAVRFYVTMNTFIVFSALLASCLAVGPTRPLGDFDGKLYKVWNFQPPPLHRIEVYSSYSPQKPVTIKIRTQALFR